MPKKVSNSKPLFGNRRSHSCKATKHAQKCNLQSVTIDGKTVRMSTRDLRTRNKNSKNVISA